MAAPQKYSSTTGVKKGGLFQKVKSKLPEKSKNGSKKTSNTITKAAQLAADFDTPIYAAPVNKAHSSGHRKMNLKEVNGEADAQKVKTLKSSENRKSESDRISELESPQRRNQGKMIPASQSSRHGSKKNSH